MKKAIVILLSILGANVMVCAQNWVSIGGGLILPGIVLYPDSASGKLFIGGEFETFNIMHGCFPANLIVSWDGLQFDSLAGGIKGGGNINTIINFQHQIYIGGNFGNGVRPLTDGFSRWNGLTFDSINRSFPQGDGPYKFCEFNNLLYCIGGFDSVGNIHSPYITAWNGNNWIPIGLPPHISVNVGIDVCAEYNNKLYFAGEFYDSLSHTPFMFLTWDGTNWNNEAYNVGGWPVALAVYNYELYIGGSYFINLPGQNIVKYDGANFYSAGGDADSYVRGLKVIGDKLYATGVFHHAGGVPANDIAVWDGYNWSALSNDIFYADSAGHGGTITDIAVYNNELYITGSFHFINSDTVHNIAKYNGWYLGENDLKKKQGEVEVYPNPTCTTLNLHMSSPATHEASPLTIRITDVLGEELYKESWSGIDTGIDVSKWSEGVYFITLRSQDSITTQKFIKL